MLLWCVLFAVLLLLYGASRGRRRKYAVQTYGPTMPSTRQLSRSISRLRIDASRDNGLTVATDLSVSVPALVGEPAYRAVTVSVPSDIDCLQDLKHRTMAAAADVALLGDFVADAFSRVDCEVMSPIEFSTADNLTSLSTHSRTAFAEVP